MWLFIGFFLISVIYTLLVKFVDVKAVGPLGSSVGFASLNVKVFDIFPYRESLHKINDYISYASFALVALFLVVGIIQLIKRKNVLKVDSNILSLGILYIATGLVFILFEKLKVNYRPILINGELKASYPSSTTMLAVVIVVSALDQNDKYNKKPVLKLISAIALIAFGSYLVIGRLISGVHWFSDIIGALIISTTLLLLYVYLKNLIYLYQDKHGYVITDNKI